MSRDPKDPLRCSAVCFSRVSVARESGRREKVCESFTMCCTAGLGAKEVRKEGSDGGGRKVAWRARAPSPQGRSFLRITPLHRISPSSSPSHCLTATSVRSSSTIHSSITPNTMRPGAANPTLCRMPAWMLFRSAALEHRSSPRSHAPACWNTRQDHR